MRETGSEADDEGKEGVRDQNEWGIHWGSKENGQHSRKRGNKLLHYEMSSHYGWKEEMVIHCENTLVPCNV